MANYDPIIAKANNGDPEAMNQMGERYLVGLDGYPVDEARAFPWLWKAAECGVSSAQHNIGFMYLYGNGIEQNHEESFRWLKQAAENGFERSYEQLAISYCNELGTERNLKLALYWAQKALSSGSETAPDLIEFIKSEMLNQIDHLNQIKRAAAEGDSSAQAELGIAYYFGQEVEQNIAESVKWLTLAAEGGSEVAQNNLSILYMEGTGVQKDESASFYWMKKAAENGHPGACYPLARKYCNAIGTEQDLESALFWAKRALEAGDEDAANLIAFIEEQLENEPAVSPEPALTSQQPGQKLDSPVNINSTTDHKPNSQPEEEAQRYIELGEQNLFGDPTNLAEAFFWLKKAAELETPSAQNNIAVMYGKGEGVAQDDVQAFYWMKKAAENGLENSYYPLAIKYCNGVGTAQSFSDALIWAKRSLEGGNEEAKELIDFLTAQTVSDTDDIKFREAKADVLLKDGRDEEALNIYRELAELGYSSSMYKLGMYYSQKSHINREEAIKWLLMGAENNNVDCMNRLGFVYTYKTLGDLDDAEGTRWYEKAALCGDSHSAVKVANRYLYSKGVEYDLEKAMKFAQLAKANGNSFGADPIIKKIQEKMKESDDHKKAKESFSKALALKNEKQYEQALPLFEEAAKLGYADAYYQIGVMYHFGYGLPVDDHQSYFFSETAARMGNPNAHMNASVCYTLVNKNSGSYPQKVDPKVSLGSVFWVMKAIAAGSTDALKALEKMKSDYLNSHNLPSDHIILTNLYSDFIHHNYNNLANLPLAAQAGNVDAECFLAYCDEMGIGAFVINLPEALYHYKAAAECGSSYAMYKVGDFYERGVACDRDMEVAKECYKLSAKWGYRVAKEKCRELKIN